MSFQERHVEADGFRIRYLEAGQGAPVVWFHGGGGLQLNRLHDLLAEKHRVIAFEAPGFGTSPVNERTNTMAELAATMGKAIAVLGIDKYSVSGISFGGKLALCTAILHPDRVEAAVLLAPAAIGRRIHGRRRTRRSSAPCCSRIPSGCRRCRRPIPNR